MLARRKSTANGKKLDAKMFLTGPKTKALAADAGAILLNVCLAGKPGFKVPFPDLLVPVIYSVEPLLIMDNVANHPTQKAAWVISDVKSTFITLVTFRFRLFFKQHLLI